MCKHFHESVRKMSEKYEQEMKRCNYVTPTSYLELILTFKSLLKGKRDDILNLKTRYEAGLGKLESASTQVTVMQNELTALRPQLLETSDETEKLMIKIEQDTIQVKRNCLMSVTLLTFNYVLCEDIQLDLSWIMNSPIFEI